MLVALQGGLTLAIRLCHFRPGAFLLPHIRRKFLSIRSIKVSTFVIYVASSHHSLQLGMYLLRRRKTLACADQERRPCIFRFQLWIRKQSACRGDEVEVFRGKWG